RRAPCCLCRGLAVALVPPSSQLLSGGSGPHKILVGLGTGSSKREVSYAASLGEGGHRFRQPSTRQVYWLSPLGTRNTRRTRTPVVRTTGSMTESFGSTHREARLHPGS